MMLRMEQNLDQLVLAQLQAGRGDWRDVAARAQVSYSWLSKFANGHIKNPGYATLKRLHLTLNQAPALAKTAQPATENVAQGVVHG